MQDRPLKIMQIVTRLNTGGVAVLLIEFISALKAQGHDVITLCGQVAEDEGDMTDLARTKGLDPVMLNTMSRELSPYNDFKAFISIIKLIHQHRPDIVHTHTAKAGFVGRLAAWLMRVPVRIHSSHGHIFYGYFSPGKTRIFLWLERFGGWLSTWVVTASSLLRNELSQTYRVVPAQKIKVIPYGFNLTHLVDAKKNPDFRANYNLPENAKLVGIVGRLVPIKNHRFFLNIAQDLAQRRADVHFLIAGDGECRSELEQQVKDLGLQGKVSFLGWVRQVETLLPELDALALTSENEGVAISLVEAMAAAIPVISTAVGEVPNTLEHGNLGRLIEPGDHIAYAAALESILDGDHPDLEAVRKKVVAYYAIERQIADFEALYYAALENK